MTKIKTKQIFAYISKRWQVIKNLMKLIMILAKNVVNKDTCTLLEQMYLMSKFFFVVHLVVEITTFVKAIRPPGNDAISTLRKVIFRF